MEQIHTIYLLGGADLEMVTIRELLESQGFREGESFFDRNLLWNNATLSAYQDLFSRKANGSVLKPHSCLTGHRLVSPDLQLFWKRQGENL